MPAQEETRDAHQPEGVTRSAAFILLPLRTENRLFHEKLFMQEERFNELEYNSRTTRERRCSALINNRLYSPWLLFWFLFLFFLSSHFIEVTVQAFSNFVRYLSYCRLEDYRFMVTVCLSYCDEKDR